ncbi:MAG: FKBP-type peptidyl-prolyl cis-trans isomerase [Theionarchaea archaeon]|nr:FKBP-type peptidyl-prolyl cis-trans isomerase [Theionarchaea archaeon]MBU7001835.1 FKBP-type peptidyl-prolyl cis-trans isomerase [Theionarchaea archaeon]MBU7020938.1 FKBP-type peptidyl-prolyl cis-trans isomerase [Theionarchaea archaeon]MBU7033992.1 FKBP-type peptidyl-prolyl cis-trans isomerase [Theionarchaea archaeon]MBU7040983.1 FKBP-type peptidyl-prolyl cis-trans isomerase [Theionarchaea archaeon]
MNMRTNKGYAAVAIIIVVSLAGIYYLEFYKKVEMGDTVYVNYTGSLDTGEIFDTTLEEVAMDDSQAKVWWFKLRTGYEPLKIAIGKGNVLPDFEMALIGMREGQKKEITISPERAAGAKDSAKIKEIPLIQTLNKEEDMTIENFKTNFRQDPQVDGIYQFQGIPVMVTEITEEMVHFVLQFQVGQEIYISLGNALVTGETETEFEITLTPTLGDVIYTVVGEGRVIEVGEDAMLVDFNAVLAGETLHYTIWVVRIEKAE